MYLQSNLICNKAQIKQSHAPLHSLFLMMITPGSLVYSRLVPFALFSQLKQPSIVPCQSPGHGSSQTCSRCKMHTGVRGDTSYSCPRCGHAPARGLRRCLATQIRATSSGKGQGSEHVHRPLRGGDRPVESLILPVPITVARAALLCFRIWS
jgi:hypothetical protein